MSLRVHNERSRSHLQVKSNSNIVLSLLFSDAMFEKVFLMGVFFFFFASWAYPRQTFLIYESNKYVSRTFFDIKLHYFRLKCEFFLSFFSLLYWDYTFLRWHFIFTLPFTETCACHWDPAVVKKTCCCYGNTNVTGFMDTGWWMKSTTTDTNRPLSEQSERTSLLKNMYVNLRPFGVN